MKVYTLLLINLFVVQAIFGQIYQQSSTTTTLEGKVTDEETGEELIGANIQILKKGIFISGNSTDFNGNYKITLDAGTYDVVTSYIGLPDKRVNGVIIMEDQSNILDIPITSGGSIFIDICCSCIYYPIPLIDKDNTTSGQKITSKTIRQEPYRKVKNIALSVAGLSTY